MCSTCTAWRWAQGQWRGWRTRATPCSSWIGHAPGHGLGPCRPTRRSSERVASTSHTSVIVATFLPTQKVLLPKGIRRAADRPAGNWSIKLCRVLPLPISENLRSSLDYSPSHLNSNMSSCLIHSRPCKCSLVKSVQMDFFFFINKKPFSNPTNFFPSMQLASIYVLIFLII